MCKKNINKRVLAAVLIAMITISFLPLTSAQHQKTDPVTLTILDNTTGTKEKNTITLSNTAAEDLLLALLKLALLKTETTPSTFKQEISNKLLLLQHNGFISAETANQLIDTFNRIPTPLHRNQPSNTKGLFFDVSNVFSGTFFGLKGSKDFTLLDLTMYEFPFFSGNINAGFYGWNRFTGNGTIFTMGFLGFKYLYDFNTTKYDFPYFPQIRGSTFGYTGLLIYFEDFNSSAIQGPFLIGIGMSVGTIWNNYPPFAIPKHH